jgi:transketolase
MKLISRPHAANLVRFAATRPNVLVLSADLTASCEADDFRERFPDRFFSMGMAEQNMVGFAGGLAREGFVPYIHTFAVFICRRAFDQVAMSVAYPNLPVRFVGFLPGITTPGGVTHQATDDLALMRALPNMTILECGDATDVESVLDAAEPVQGPVYIRNLRGLVPRLFPAAEPLRLGRSRRLSAGRDLTLLTSGICTEEGMKATAVLARKELEIEHLHVSTLKPFDDPQVIEAVSALKLGVITLENHSVVGGLGSAVAELMAERGCRMPLIRLGLRDVYAHGASRAYLMREYGLDALAVVRAAETLAGEPLGVDPAELASVELAPAPSLHQAEDL